MSSNKAWVTLATNDSYSLGALVLAHSLKTAKTAHKLAILITPGVTASMKKQIEAVFDDVRVVDVLDSKDQTHLALMSRPELGVTFTKLHCWTLTNYEKCVFLDADTLVLQNCDELFEREELSAAPDPGWPDCFNSGVFVFKPSQETFGQLLEFARTKGSFDGGDQGLLNMYFKEWSHKDITKHLSFTYNVVWSSTYSYLPALKQFGQNMKIIHFIASSKPWLQSFDTETRLVTPKTGGTGLQALLQYWWDLFCHHVHPSLSTEMIESRLSSRYSRDLYPKILPNINTPNDFTPNNFTPSNNTFNHYCTPTYEPPKQDHYNFIDPWEEYLDANEQKSNEFHEQQVSVNQVENVVRGDGNIVVEAWSDNRCEKEVASNYYVNHCVEEQKSDHSFQNNVLEECNAMLERNNVQFENRIEINETKQEQDDRPVNNEYYPACSDEIPINPNSSLSVNNCRPDSPTHCEVPMDQNCDLNGGLAGQFARVSLGEKSADEKALDDFLRRQSWEQGHMDYLGKDSFSNIWAKINETLGKTPEVLIEPSVAKEPSAPEVVHSEEPKPLKSALKKSSTTIPPVESELETDGGGEPPVKQLEKLDLSKDVLKESKTPDTPTVTSPSPPSSAPATPQAQEPPKPEAAAVETPEVSSKPAAEDAPKAEPAVVAAAAAAEVTPTSDSSAKEPAKLEDLPKTDSPASKPEELAKGASQQSAEKPSASNDPPVPPKRANKGSSNAPKNGKPSEKK